MERETDGGKVGWIGNKSLFFVLCCPLMALQKALGSHLSTQFKNHVNNKRSKQKMVCLNCRSCEETRGEDANCEDHVDTKHSRGKLCYSNEHCRGNEPERKEGRAE